MAWMISTRLRADREELHDRDLLALVGPRPDVDEEAAQVVAQEPRVAAADADAGEERRRAEEQHDEEVPPALFSRRRASPRSGAVDASRTDTALNGSANCSFSSVPM